eukprot:76262-Chlamydomonas_euryale.AAC.2
MPRAHACPHLHSPPSHTFTLRQATPSLSAKPHLHSLSSHTCTVVRRAPLMQVPLPGWVLKCGEADPDLFFSDRLASDGSGGARRNREYISLWADEAPVLAGRTPLQVWRCGECG